MFGPSGLFAGMCENQLDEETTDWSRYESSRYLPELGEELDPGVYFVDDEDPSTTTGGITFLIESPGWTSGGEGPRRASGVSLHVHNVDQRGGPHAPGCDGGGPTPETVEWTAADLANAFGAGGFTVREAPAAVNAFGHDGHHVVIEVPEGCDDAVGFQWNIFLNPGEVMEAWFFDMNGHIVMVEANSSIGSSEEDMAELRAVIDTLDLTS
jgi:hypothetical protein